LSAASRNTNGASELRIDASDGQAGVRGYDVAIVENDVTRTVLAQITLAPTVVFTGLRTGSVYRWVVTATDNVNNVVTATATVVVVAQATKTRFATSAACAWPCAAQSSRWGGVAALGSLVQRQRGLTVLACAMNLTGLYDRILERHYG
jgi:hypothetical protein